MKLDRMSAALVPVAMAAGLSTAAAQVKVPPELCQRRVDEVAGRIPDLGDNPDAYKQLGIGKEHLQAALAALDAARLVKDSGRGCLTLVDTAEAMLAKGRTR